MNYPNYKQPRMVLNRPTALSYLFEQSMRGHAGGATIIGGIDPGDSPAERIGPLRGIHGEYTHVKAQFANGSVTGLVCLVDGPRLVLCDFDRDTYITINVEHAEHVTVQYVTPPEETTHVRIAH